jgi:hypothetical protein
MKMNKKLRVIPLAILLALGLQTVASAEERGHFGHGGEIHNFHERDVHVWRGGRWVHDFHDGRLGWWWFAGGMWYFYNAPVYPYPDPYVPSAVIVQQPPAQVYIEQGQPAAPAAPQAAPPAPAAAPQAAPQYWYYCKNPQGYYPYVNQCPVPWQQVPATPNVAPVAP